MYKYLISYSGRVVNTGPLIVGTVKIFIDQPLCINDEKDIKEVKNKMIDAKSSLARISFEIMGIIPVGVEL